MPTLFQKHPWLPWSLFFVALGLGLCLLIYSTEIDPPPDAYDMTTMESDNLRGLVAGVTAAGLILLIAVRRLRPALRPEAPNRWFNVVVAALVILGSLTYFYVPRGVARSRYLNAHDLYHYFLGAKYYGEVGYNEYYGCHLRADQERRRPKYRARDRVRDLRDYRLRRVAEVRREADCSGFSEERWEEFRHDLDYLDRFSQRRVITDHGYNGTPFHALLASNFAELFEVDTRGLVLATFVDIMAVCLLFAVLVWGFGWPVTALFALFLFANIGDFYFHVSFSRYWWLLTLGSGLACLERQRYGAAAVLMVLSAMLNVFPLLFFAGLGVKMLFQLVRERRLEGKYKTFVTWAAGATVICAALSLTHDRPVERYQTFFSNMSRHSGLLTSTRTGFRYNFMYRGEVIEDDPHSSWSSKREDLVALYPVYIPLVGMILLLGALIALRLDDLRATVLSGFLLFFMLFSTVIYYYALASVLVLLWIRDLERRRGLVMLALLFATMGLVHIGWELSEYRRFLNTALLTFFFTFNLGVSLIVLAFSSGLFGPESWLGRRIVSPLWGALARRFSRETEGGRRRRNKVWLALVLLAIAGVLLAVFGGRPSLRTDRADGDWQTLLATGDSALVRRMHFVVEEHGAEWPLQGLHRRIRAADIAMTNLETVITTRGDLFPKHGRNPYYFRGRPELLDILTSAGFDVVATANNHTMDYGPEAVDQQAEILEASGIAHAGSGSDLEAASRPVYIRSGEVTLALVSLYIGGGRMAAAAERAGVFQVRRDDEVLEVVRGPYEEARQQADVVVFSPHWGGNYTEAPSESRRELARELIDLGFDAILGHSAHQLHGMEIYDGRPIIYDMGNFIADWSGDERARKGAIFELEFDQRGFSAIRVIPIWLHGGHSRLAEGRRARAVRELFIELTRALDDRIQFERDGEELVLTFAFNGQRAAHVAEPEEIHRAGSTRPVPERFTSLEDVTVVEERPEFAQGFEPIDLDGGLRIIGASTPEVVHVRSGFRAEVAIEVTRSLGRGPWEAEILAVHDNGRDRFVYRHPVSNGGTVPSRWRPGQIVIDRTCVRRRSSRPTGRYDLFWTLRNRRSRRTLEVYPDSDPQHLDLARIGSIEVRDDVNRRASGIDWEGDLERAR